MGFHSGKIGDIEFDVLEKNGINISDEEIRAYIDRYKKENPDKHLTKIIIKEVPGTDEVDLEYNYKPISFERIRRITGYLVGDMSKWNDAKTKECADRIKHNVIKEAKDVATSNDGRTVIGEINKNR